MRSRRGWTSFQPQIAGLNPPSYPQGFSANPLRDTGLALGQKAALSLPWRVFFMAISLGYYVILG